MKAKLLLLAIITFWICAGYWMAQDTVRIEREVYCGACHERGKR